LLVTLYGSAAKPVAAITGTENGRVARVLVLDREGRIVWFDDDGYSARKAIEIAKLMTAPERRLPIAPRARAVAQTIRNTVLTP